MQPQSNPVNPRSDQDLIENDEHVLIVVRKHWAGLAAIYLLACILIISIVALTVFVVPDLKLSSATLGLTSMGAMVVGLIFAVVLSVMVYVYKKSSLTLTDRSLVQIIQRSLFNKKVSRLSMSNVEDVNAEQKGIIASMLGYGTLTVQTAGEEDNFVFSFCPNPNFYAEKILEARQAYVQHSED
jgi:hypothetical protein